MDGFPRLTIRGFLSSFHNRSALHPIAEKYNSCRNLKMSKVFYTKSQHDFFYGVPKGLGVLMWYFGGIIDNFYQFSSGKNSYI